MDKYYIVKPSIKGVYPQVKCDSVPVMQLITPWKIFPENLITLDFTFDNRARITDVLNKLCGPITDFLISEKFKNIISDCKIMNHQYFKALVKTKKENLIYYLLHLSQPDLVNYIDYKSSLFYETEWEFRKGPIKIDSYEHYERLHAQDKEAKFGVSIDKLVMNDDFDRSIDMFFFLPFENKVYISERMRKLIEENNITGLDIVGEILI